MDGSASDGCPDAGAKEIGSAAGGSCFSSAARRPFFFDFSEDELVCRAKGGRAGPGEAGVGTSDGCPGPDAGEIGNDASWLPRISKPAGASNFRGRFAGCRGLSAADRRPFFFGFSVDAVAGPGTGAMGVYPDAWEALWRVRASMSALDGRPLFLETVTVGLDNEEEPPTPFGLCTRLPGCTVPMGFKGGPAGADQTGGRVAI